MPANILSLPNPTSTTLHHFGVYSTHSTLQQHPSCLQYVYDDSISTVNLHSGPAPRPAATTRSKVRLTLPDILGYDVDTKHHFRAFHTQGDAGRHDTPQLGDGIHTFRFDYSTIAHQICDRGCEDSVACDCTTSRSAVAKDTMNLCLL